MFNWSDVYGKGSIEGYAKTAVRRNLKKQGKKYKGEGGKRVIS